ncbi:MAG: gamma-butyrobetaine hydroxylase-like domain-containing protein [Planctomycetota bacterium]
MDDQPQHLDLDRDRGLTVRWSDGRTSFFPVATLRRLSPSAETRELRKQMAANPLTVLPAAPASAEGLRAESAELVGNYAIRIRFSDGHDTGIYSWRYLRELDRSEREARENATPHDQAGDAAGDAAP